MINARSLVIGIIVGAIVSLLVHEMYQFGLAFGQWSFQGPRIGQALITGALIGAISQLTSQSRGRR